MLSEDYNPLNDGIAMCNISKLQSKGESYEAVKKISEVLQNRPKSIIEELKIFRTYTRKLLRYIEEREKLLEWALKQNERFENDCDDKKYQRWTNEEDEMLIELVCDETKSLLELSTIMGRTVPAIKTRITKLVGVKRISQNIAGRFFGTIDGEEKEVNLNGTLYKGA